MGNKNIKGNLMNERYKELIISSNKLYSKYVELVEIKYYMHVISAMTGVSLSALIIYCDNHNSLYMLLEEIDKPEAYSKEYNYVETMNAIVKLHAKMIMKSPDLIT